MMLLGEELGLPNAIGCKVEIYEDQPTELQKLFVRKALVDKVVHEKRRKLFEKSAAPAGSDGLEGRTPSVLLRE